MVMMVMMLIIMMRMVMMIVGVYLSHNGPPGGFLGAIVARISTA
jgi:hypothetical protein